MEYYSWREGSNAVLQIEKIKNISLEPLKKRLIKDGWKIVGDGIDTRDGKNILLSHKDFQYKHQWKKYCNQKGIIMV